MTSLSLLVGTTVCTYNKINLLCIFSNEGDLKPQKSQLLYSCLLFEMEVNLLWKISQFFSAEVILVLKNQLSLSEVN